MFICWTMSLEFQLMTTFLTLFVFSQADLVFVINSSFVFFCNVIKSVYRSWHYSAVDYSITEESTKSQSVSNTLYFATGFLLEECIKTIQSQNKLAATVAERLKAMFLNCSIISALCLVWVRAPLWPHVRQAKFYLRCVRWFFTGFSRFRPTY